jgi:hypothetical protein
MDNETWRMVMGVAAVLVLLLTVIQELLRSFGGDE